MKSIVEFVAERIGRSDLVAPCRWKMLFGGPDQGAASSSKESIWPYMSGALLVLSALFAVERLSQTALAIPNAPAVLVLVVVFSSFTGGLRSGLISAAILDVAFFACTVGQTVHYTSDNLRRVTLWAVTMPCAALMVGILKVRADRISEEAVRRQRDYAASLEAALMQRERGEASRQALACQQAAVSELVQRALAGADLGALMQEAAGRVAQTLHVDHCNILELLPDGDALLLRAGAGWNDGYIGRATVGAGADSQAGYTLLCKEPVIVEDLHHERRFNPSPLLRDHGVTSGSTVVIDGHAGGRPFGVLGAYTTKQRSFTKDDIQFLQAVANVLGTIIERKRSEESLRMSEERTRLIIDTAYDAFVSMDSAGLITAWNAQAEATFGWSRQEAIGRRLAETIIPGRYREAHAAGLRHFLSTGIGPVLNKRIEIMALHRDGHEFPAELTISPVRWGQTYIFNSFVHDITERKLAETTIRESEERFRLLVEGVKDYAIFTLDPNGFVSTWNAGAESITGYRAEEIIGQHFWCFFVAEDVQSGKPERELQVAVARGQMESEAWRVRKDGSRFWANVVITALRDDAGQLRGFSKLTRDFTERKQAEEALARQAQDLARSNAALEQFAYVASHDLQEPLRKIQAFGDRLKKGCHDALSDQGRDYLERMLGAARRMHDLIDDLLAFSRITARERAFAPVDLAKLTTDVLGDLESQVEQTAGRVDVADLPTIDADATQIRQLMQNLIGNALKFHREGVPPVVQVHAKRVHSGDGDAAGNPPPGDLCQIIVEDNGIGFDERHSDRIFHLFQRLHSRNEYEGTGIGLALCRKIAELHGGSITATATPGQGATFVVTLPVRQPIETRETHE